MTLVAPAVAVGSVGDGETNAALAGIVAALLDIATTDRSPDEIMQVMAEHAQALTRASGAVVEMVDGHELVYRASTGSAAAMVGTRISRNASLSGLALRTGAPLCCDDSETDDRVDRAMCRRVGLRSMVVAPLADRGQAVGVLKVMSAEPHAFGERDVTNLQILVASLGTAIRRRQAEQEVERSNKRLRDLIDGVGPSMFVGLMTPQGVLVECNRPAQQAVGRTLEELLGKPFADTYWWSHSHAARQQLRAAIERAAGGEGSRYDVQVRGIDEAMIDVDFSLQPVRDESGKVVFLVPSASIITERKEAEAALEASVADLRAMAEAMPQMVWIARPDGESIYVNQRWTDYTGISLENSLGYGWLAPFHPGDRERATMAWEHARATTSTYVVESRVRHNDGAYRWWLIRGEPQRGTGGTILKWFGTCTDIHDLKLAELETTRLNRALTMVSSCNETLVRAQDEQQVMDQICKIAVDRGGYRRASVGYAQDDPSRSTKVFAHAGDDDGLLSEISLPLSSANRTFGVLKLLSAEVIQASDEELTLLRGLANSVAFAIESLRAQEERRRLQLALTKVAVGVSRAAGAEFFQQLVRSMAEALGARAGFVSQSRPDKPAAARTIAAIVDGQIIDNLEYAIKGTPCERLLTSDVCVIEDGLTDRFSVLPSIAALGVQGYVGRRICGSSGQTFGHVFVLFEEPVKDPEFLTSMLQIYGARAASELERRQTDAHVQAQAAMLDDAHDAIQVRDLRGRITYWNKGCERTYGWTAAEMIGQQAGGMRQHPGQLPAAMFALQANGKWHGEMLKRTKDGRELTVEVRLTLVRDAEGKATSILAIDTDITARRLLESQLMVSDRLASVGTLAAGVAHEINNPLAAVLANLDFIVEAMAAVADPKIMASIGDAREAAERVRFIVRDLKAFARSPGEEQRGPVDIMPILESSLRMAANDLQQRARVVKRYGPVPLVDANEARLGQVFLNLIVNAVQALPEGDAGQNEIRLTTRVDGARVIVEVRDTGAGIPPEIIGRIFNPFFTTKAVGVGTGLGLAICQRIVTDMGGELTVASNVGKGTTFRVALAMARTDESPIEVAAPPQPVVASERRGRVLVVDDDDMVLRGVARSLAAAHDVVPAHSGKEALALIAGGQRFDLIVCDLMMPGMTGMDLHRELSRLVPEQAKRTVFLTGGAFTEESRRFLSDVATEHIEKPFRPADLRALVQRYLL